MQVDIDHYDEGPISPEDPEYLRRYRDAMSAYAALEIEAWQMACAEEATTTVSTVDRPSRQDGGR
jgi:hypothetical protein